jgi:hypothetical protein
MPRPTVRVCPHRDLEILTAALANRELLPEAALIIYLIMFHGFRNSEIVHTKGLGFIDGKFRLVIEKPVILSRRLTSHRIEPYVTLPTDVFHWLREIVTGTLDARMKKLKDGQTDYLFVSGGWRNLGQPMCPTMVLGLVRQVTLRLCGHPLTPSLLRQATATLYADSCDYTACCRLGWSPQRALSFAYGVREITVAEDPSEVELSKSKLNGKKYRVVYGIPWR